VRAARIAFLSLRLGLLNAFQYRTDFWIAMLQSLVALGTSLAGIAIVFGQTDTLAGWSQEELIALVGVFMVVAGLLGLVIRPSLERLMEGRPPGHARLRPDEAGRCAADGQRPPGRCVAGDRHRPRRRPHRIRDAQAR
jgi:hypothetical protein